jgi:enoyl-CoA hydratase/carnithine racemase
MKSEHIRFEFRDGLAQITLDRPEQLNAFSGTLGRELAEASATLPGLR